MKDFEKIVLNQVALHPSCEPADLIKLCFQAAYGAEHLIADVERAKLFFYTEYEATSPMDCSVFEKISDKYCRVNIAAWKFRGYDPDKLFDIFIDTAKHSAPNNDGIYPLLDTVGHIAERGELPFSVEAWQTVLSKYEGGPVHHSQRYRDAEAPAYRIVLTESAKKSID